MTDCFRGCKNLPKFLDLCSSSLRRNCVCVSSFFAFIACIILCFRRIRLWRRSRKSEKSNLLSGAECPRASSSYHADLEVRLRAKEAAEQRQTLWKKNQALKKIKLQQRSIILQVISEPVSIDIISSNDDMTLDEIVAASAPVFYDGFVMFRNLFQFPDASRTAAMLRRLAHEFLPIIRQRGYNITSVSEFCCCGDGMDYHLGGKSLSVRPGKCIAGHESENVMGYNRVVQVVNSRFDAANHYESSIHLRFRRPQNHFQIIPYEDICEKFCHELAHCVHHDHGPQFYTLMRELQDLHAKLLRKNS